MAVTQIDALLRTLDSAYDKTSWHGPNLRGSLRRVTVPVALWRPSPARHNIWEQATHAAYWKYVARRRLLNEKRGSFPLSGSNWLDAPAVATEKDWKAVLKLLDDIHASLRAAVAALDEKRLFQKPAGSKVDSFMLLTGVAAHDVYHAGQVQLLRRLATDAGVE